MSSCWETANLCEIADIEMGQSPPGTTVNADGEGMPLLNGPTEFGSHHPDPVQWTTDARKIARAGDILFCVRGSTTGRMNWADRDYAIGRGVAALRHRSGGEYQPFLRGLVELNLPELLAGATGSTFPNVSRTQLSELSVLAPPLSDQKHIAHILGTLDDKIELNRRMNRTLEAIGRAIFKSWFVDFDPVIDNAILHNKPIPDEFAERAEVRRDMLSRKGGAEGVASLPPSTFGSGARGEGVASYRHLFPDSFQDSPLGKIPKGWEIVTLRECAELLDQKRIPLNARQRSERQGPYPYYGAAGVMDHVDDYLFEGVHLLVGEDGSVATEQGHPVLQYVWGKFWVNNHAHVLVGAAPVSTEFLYMALNRTYISPYVTGAVQPKLNQGNLNRVCFVLPSEPLLERFAAAVESLFATKIHLADQSASLAQTRDVLLPQLLSGAAPFQGGSQDGR